MRFLLGFVTAIVGSAVVYFALLKPTPSSAPCAGICGAGTRCESEHCIAVREATEEVSEAAPRRGRRRRPARSVSRLDKSAGGQPTDDSAISDDMELRPQVIDMENGGEAQLSTVEIESTVGRNFGSIRRCILLAQSENEPPVRGRMPIGIRIRPTGQVAAVTVRPPGPLAGTDLGPCVRSAVARIRFPRFNGREMAVTYPVTLE